MGNKGMLEEQMKELQQTVGSLEKLARGYRIKLYWYLGVLILSTLGTLSYQVSAAWQIRKIGNMFQEKINSVDGRVDEILTKVENIADAPTSLLGGKSSGVKIKEKGSKILSGLLDDDSKDKKEKDDSE